MPELFVVIDGDWFTCKPQPAPTPEPARVIAYSQRDERWAAIHLGASTYTMGNAGCAVTAATMVATKLDPTLTPLDVVNYLNEHGGFTAGGLLYWAKVAEFVEDMEPVDYRKWTKTSADMSYVTSVLSRGPAVLQVDFVPGGALNTHFVTALRMTADGKDIECIDPWTGERGTVLGLYSVPGWTLQRAVYALAEYSLERG